MWQTFIKHLFCTGYLLGAEGPHYLLNHVLISYTFPFILNNYNFTHTFEDIINVVKQKIIGMNIGKKKKHLFFPADGLKKPVDESIWNSGEIQD